MFQNRYALNNYLCNVTFVRTKETFLRHGKWKRAEQRLHFQRHGPAHVSTRRSKIEMAVLFEKNMCFCVRRSIQAQCSQSTWLRSQGVRISAGIDFHIVTILSQSAYNFYIIRNYIKELFLQWKIMLFQCNPVYFTIVLWNLLYLLYKE